ncbi:P27 family phage terminase small subunit [Priestia aryabhattai]|uniref:P27 family phage terminase small subunit n=1 Tax=Priestia megaterium TaxID=1404 RepID=UPI0039B82719
MALTLEEKAIRKIVKKTVEKMKAVGTYRPQFDSAIRTYSEMKYEMDILTQHFYATGFKRTEEYTNKAGATNIRKTAEYLALEKLRDDVDKRENNLGLTPAGLKKINDEMKNGPKKKVSALAAALSSLE